MTLLLAGWIGCAALAAAAETSFEDETVRIELPAGWHIDGEDGEYLLESDDQNVASLLLLAFETEKSMAERLAEIEEQFLATQIIRIESSELRTIEGEDVFYRRYRLMMAGSEAEDATSIQLHQYSFWRAEVQVLLQIETPPGKQAQEDLFTAIFGSLEIQRVPDPFLFEEPE